MNTLEQGIASYIGERRLRWLQQFTIGIAGAGGLGSNCAMHLVRSGFCRFVLADFDHVDASNLNRQAYSLDQINQLKVVALTRNMKAINPDVTIDIRTSEVTPDNMVSIFKECDAVVEAFDAPVCKKAFVEEFMGSDKLLVFASGIGGYGDIESIRCRQIRDTVYVVGDMETECSMENPPLSPKVGVAAAMQADVILSYYLGLFEKQGDS